MSDLHQALADIRSIRRQVAQTTEFRGYGPLTLSATALFAFVTAAAQTIWLAEPAAHPAEYIALWLTTAVVSSALIATQMLMRANRLHSGMAEEMVLIAVTQFLPAGIAGAILPLVLLHVGGGVFWLLPGLWQLIFSLGVFASCRCLPRPMLLVGIWFLLTGLGCIAVGGSRSLAPAMMAVPFAGGMALVAVIHFSASRKANRNETEDV